MEKPNWTVAVAGLTRTFTPILPVPCVYGPEGARFQVIEVTNAVAVVLAVRMDEAGPDPEAFTARTWKL